ncbi:hypothetical protein A3F66_00235 [candidate division TM6 bacterium RIFCSPHIGHO2_12_FULL_32_22]|nr:MAG: hypothetical protein A3F66_00235 [candidate division TM6 bacterium RIFCSPHIGHO2_12_FULL_32_22]
MKNKRLIYKILDQFRSLFLNGILIILPIGITIMIFNAIFKIVKNWLSPLQHILPISFQDVPQAEFILALALILVVGFISKVFFLKSILHKFEFLIFKIPLVRPIYSGIKQLVEALTDQGKISFKTVVMAEFPTAGSYCLGFLTGESLDAVTPDKSKRYYNIFIPTTPNPTTGFFILMPEEKIINTDLTRHEAMTMIISGGIIKPDRFI